MLELITEDHDFLHQMSLIVIVCIEFSEHYVRFPYSVLFKVSHTAQWLIHFLTLNRILGRCNKQGNQINIKIHLLVKKS